MAILHIFNQDELLHIAESFGGINNIKSVNLISHGSIHDTYIVSTYDYQLETFILQCLNKEIFNKPEIIMQNLDNLLKHCSENLLTNKGLNNGRRWQQPEVLKTFTNQKNLFHYKSSYWRAFKYINSTLSLSYIKEPKQAFEAGFALSFFHLLVKDLNPKLIINPLPDIHSIHSYIIRYESLIDDLDISSYPPHIRTRIDSFKNFFYSQSSFISSISSSSFDSQLINQMVHGDPKISNFLFDELSGSAVSLIDLDTVAFGSIQYDIADCLRSICNKSGEEPKSLSNVYFDLDLCIEMLKGYFSVYKDSFRPQINIIPESIKLITLELSVRFFIDFLEGNIYFKTSTPYQNLYKSEVQVALFLSINKIYGDLVKQIDTFKS